VQIYAWFRRDAWQLKMRFLATVMLFLLCTSCATSTIDYKTKMCTTIVTCGPTADCAALLYNKASAIMSEAEQHHKHKMFALAESKYYEAAHLLRCADKKLSASQLEDFDDWKTANLFGLERLIKEALIKCDRLARNCKWRM